LPESPVELRHVVRRATWQAGHMAERSTPDDTELKARLTPLQYEVTQLAGTERAFSGEYWDTKDPGLYRCIVCDEPLFSSDTKYDSGSGWPSFWQAIDPEKVELHEDRSYGMVRIEARCATCHAHLGHVFPDGPAPTGERFCMNSASLRLDAEADADPGHEQSSD
jgi:peptide-methionine (R)-S-oxide reductase